MSKQRLFGTQLEFLLAEQMAPPGRHNYNISRYIVFEGELDLEALIAAVEQAFLEAGIVHRDYEVDAEGAWQVDSARPACKVDVVDLRDARDPMTQCLEMIREDTHRIVPVLAKEAKIQALVFLLGQHDGCSRHVYYHRFHHVQVDGYIGQLLVRRIADLYNSYSGRSDPRPASFLGHAALLDVEDQYVRSGQCSTDKTFWNEYLAEYLRRSGHAVVAVVAGCETSAQPLSQNISIASTASGMTELPINSVTAAIMTTLYQVSGVACQMIGMTFMRRSRGKLDRIMSPMVTVLPLWVDLEGVRGPEAIVSRVGDAIRQIKTHQLYGGERAIRDLGYTGREGLYLCTVNYRVFDKNPIIFNNVKSSSCIVSSGPAPGLNIIVSIQDDGIQLNIESVYKIIHGLDIKTLAELLQDNIVAMLGDGYHKRMEPVARYGYTDLRFPARGE